MKLPPEIFKAYDIRGVVGKTLTPPIVRSVGQALGSLARERGRDTLVVGRDGRLSGPELAAAVADGIRAAGANVVDIGMVATPMTYFAAHPLGTIWIASPATSGSRGRSGSPSTAATASPGPTRPSCSAASAARLPRCSARSTEPSRTITRTRRSRKICRT
jgi:hypothetical protein